MSNPVGQSHPKWLTPLQQQHVSGGCLAWWVSMSMGIPSNIACHWKGHGGGCGDCIAAGTVTGIGWGAVFQENAFVVKPAVGVGVTV